MNNKFQGTLTLYKLMLKHEKVKILIWLISLISITLLTAVTYHNMYQNSEEIKAFALIVQNPVMKAMVGRGYPTEAYNTALVFAHEMFIFTAIAVAIMNIMFTVRLMRNDEEEGRVELIRSLPVGRYSYLLAASLVILLINVILILGIGLGLTIASLPGITFNGSMLYGATLVLVGLTFTSIAALFCQLTSSTKSASNLSFGLLIFFYIIRGIGDIKIAAFLYLSPLGLISKILVFYENHWWPLLILLGIIIFLGLCTTWLYRNRDLGAGLINSRQGKVKASKWVKTPIGLIIRLERLSLILWLVGFFLFTFTFGAVLKEFDQYFSDVELFIKILGPDAKEHLLEEITFFLIKMFSLFAIIPSLILLMRIYKEEAKQRLEQVYIRNLSRIKYFIIHFVIALIYSIIMQLAIVMTIWLAGKKTLQSILSFSDLIQLGLIFLPSIWVVLSLTAFLIGFLPRQVPFIWGYFVFIFIEFYLNKLLKLPQVISKLSVFSYIPKIPTEKINLLTSTILIFIGLGLLITGLFTYRKRDLNY